MNMDVWGLPSRLQSRDQELMSVPICSLDKYRPTASQSIDYNQSCCINEEGVLDTLKWQLS